MTRPTLALACILKNEAHHLPRLLESVEGCFDEIHLTDTGSTDGTIELIEKYALNPNFNPAKTKIFLHHFTWCDDFAAARNASFAPVKTDFIMWMDGDDVLGKKENFIKWRDDVMKLSDYWLATYNYAFDDNGTPICSFARERVVRTAKGYSWKYFVHEGMMPKSPFGETKTSMAPMWTVDHMRTAEDMKTDRSRNLSMFKAHEKTLDARMIYYYGKEFFENNQPLEAYQWLMRAIDMKELETHDRLLCIQYAAYACIACNQSDKAIQIAMQGIHLAPTRAEYYSVIGDALLKNQRFIEAIPLFTAASVCEPFMQGGQFPIFSTPALYKEYPRNQLARIHYQTGQFEQALKIAEDCFERYHNPETKVIIDEINKALNATRRTLGTAKKTEDIIITCPPVGPYPWDEDLYRTNGMGGSETAAIEMSRWIAEITGRKVMIFNNRKDIKNFESGVQYLPVETAQEYLSKYEPKTHIAWRHSTRLTEAPSYIWCHDLFTPGAENLSNYDKIITLSPFHKRYIQAMQGIPDEKFLMSRNGIVPSRFKNVRIKNPNKIIFPSSPDRGLDRAMWIVDKARKVIPDMELHVFYGLDNLEKYGLGELARKLKGMMRERPWVKYHGNVHQDVLIQNFQEAAVWLYPANFIESFCISALEALASGTFPLVREIGALQDTLREAHDSGMAKLIDRDAETEFDQQIWAEELVKAIKEERWKNVKIDLQKYSWEQVAREWCEMLSL